MSRLRSIFSALTGSSVQPPKRPWEQDQKLIETVQAEGQSKGILAVADHAAAMEAALAGVKTSYALARKGDGDTSYVLSDGTASTLTGLLGAAAGNPSGKTVAVQNPYPLISFFLASYYVETGRAADAVRVLEIGLALPSIELADTYRHLLIEYGASLSKLKRWQEALAAYDAGLKLENTDRKVRALMMRGRGMALIELGQLDEAELCYHVSLDLDPGNRIALGELVYITRRRAGAAPKDANLTSVQPKQD